MKIQVDEQWMEAINNMLNFVLKLAGVEALDTVYGVSKAIIKDSYLTNTDEVTYSAIEPPTKPVPEITKKLVVVKKKEVRDIRITKGVDFFWKYRNEGEIIKNLLVKDCVKNTYFFLESNWWWKHQALEMNENFIFE